MELVFTLFLPLAGMVLGGVVIYLALKQDRLKTESQRAVQLALLDKFTSGDEMTTFLATDEGRKLVDQLASPSNKDPRERTVGMVIGGCVMFTLSLGCLALYWLGVAGRLFLVPAVLSGAMALGLLAGGALSYRISSKLGLVRGR